MKKFFILQLFIVCFFSINAQVSPNAVTEGYDVILVAGQSNTHYGYRIDKNLDVVNPRVYALNRHSGKDYRIGPATPVLDFWTRSNDRNSFAITFSNLYVENLLTNNNRKVLVIPCGYSGSSIVNWSKGRNLYTDAMNRVNYVLENIPGSKLVAILWHQGEANVGWAPYKETLDKMIADMRADIKQENVANVPFILGGMVPYWVNSNARRKEQQKIIKDTPNRVANTGYADSEYPFVISKPNNASDAIHFDSNGQRELGRRYFDVFMELVN